MPVKINGVTSGSVTLAAPATGSDVTLTLPAASGTVETVPGAWTAYTPTLSGTGWAIGDGTASGFYCQIGKVVHFRATFVMGSTSTYGAGAATVSVPLAHRAGSILNAGITTQYNDLSPAATYKGDFRWASSTTLVLVQIGTNGLHTSVSTNVPFTWANGDRITFGGTYEIA